MIQVKAFDEEHEDDLSDAINDYLLEHEEQQVIDIKYATAIYQEDEEEELIYSFSALLIYSS